MSKTTTASRTAASLADTPVAAQTPVAEASAELAMAKPSWKDTAAAQLGDAGDQLRAWRQAMFDALEASADPEASFTRKACAYILSLCASFGAGYLVGMAMNALLMTAAVSASLFLTIMVWIIGLLIAMYLGSKIGAAVYNGVIHSVIEDTATGAWHSVRSWFTTEKAVTA